MTYKIDHVVHGAIASAATYGAMLGATPAQIESAIGMVVAHYIPWRAIRAGKQLSDSKGASAAISTEVAILSMLRSMRGFVGPQDIFRNPEAIWRQFEPTSGDSPFDLVLSHSGDDFAVMGMHFKLGLYEHQSAGALQGLIDLISANPKVLEQPDSIDEIRIVAYEPAFGIIGDPAKRDPQTRQSADHSMAYIVSTMLRKAIDLAAAGDGGAIADGNDAWWKVIMLLPEDYGREALHNTRTRALMDRIVFEHGGPEYDRRYPDGIPTSITIMLDDGTSLESGMVMYPSGHARNTTANLKDILQHKAEALGSIALADASPIINQFKHIADLDATAVSAIMNFQILNRPAVD
jgi:2-methylcitrate dehydratase